MFALVGQKGQILGFQKRLGTFYCIRLNGRKCKSEGAKRAEAYIVYPLHGSLSENVKGATMAGRAAKQVQE
jgi:hypothetical protein